MKKPLVLAAMGLLSLNNQSLGAANNEKNINVEKLSHWIENGTVPGEITEYIKDHFGFDLQSEIEARIFLGLIKSKTSDYANDSGNHLAEIEKSFSPLSKSVTDDDLFATLSAKIGISDPMIAEGLHSMVMGIAF